MASSTGRLDREVRGVYEGSKKIRQGDNFELHKRNLAREADLPIQPYHCRARGASAATLNALCQCSRLLLFCLISAWPNHRQAAW